MPCCRWCWCWCWCWCWGGCGGGGAMRGALMGERKEWGVWLLGVPPLSSSTTLLPELPVAQLPAKKGPLGHLLLVAALGQGLAGRPGASPHTTTTCALARIAVPEKEAAGAVAVAAEAEAVVVVVMLLVLALPWGMRRSGRRGATAEGLR